MKPSCTPPNAKTNTPRSIDGYSTRHDPVRLARHQPSSGGNRDGESSAPAAFVYVADVTRERRNRSAGTHTRSPPDPFRAPAHHAPRNERTSRPGADRIDVAPRAERFVCLPLRNDAVQSQARSRRCSFHSARSRRQALNSRITKTACVSVCARCLLPAMAHDCTWPQIDVRLDTDVRLGKSPAVVFARVWVDTKRSCTHAAGRRFHR